MGQTVGMWFGIECRGCSILLSFNHIQFASWFCVLVPVGEWGLKESFVGDLFVLLKNITDQWTVSPCFCVAPGQGPVFYRALEHENATTTTTTSSLESHLPSAPTLSVSFNISWCQGMWDKLAQTTTPQLTNHKKITSLSPMPRSRTWEAQKRRAQKRSAFLSHQRRATRYCIQRLIQTSIRLGMIGWFAIPDILKANNNAALSSTTNQRNHHWNLTKGYPKLQKIWKELSFPASSSCLVSIHPIYFAGFLSSTWW